MQKVGNTTDTADANGEWTDGNVAQGIPPTIINSKILNTYQRELVNIVLSSGLELDPTDDGQVLKAIEKLLSSASAVSSVNEKTGDVTLNASDVGALSNNGGEVGVNGIISNGDITANKKNIILRKSSEGGGYYIQDSSGKSLALISATDAGDITISSLIAGGSLRYNGAMFASNARFNTDGNVNGSSWNGWLSDYLANQFSTKATYDYVNALKNTSGNGWWKDTATGNIVQWGFMNSTSSNTSFGRFNIDFPNQSLVVIATLGTNLNSGQTVYANVANSQGFDYKTSVSDVGFGWIAIGR
ncbi:TPA: hypothetical protein ACKQGK_004326 [Serratia marcescens]